jgi:hypothetical protein
MWCNMRSLCIGCLACLFGTLGVLACDMQQSLFSSHMCAAVAPAEGFSVVVNMRVALNLSLLGLV